RGFKNVIKVRQQLLSFVERLYKGKGKGNNAFKDDDEDQTLDVAQVLKCFLRGFVKNTAIGMPDKSFRTTPTGETIAIHPSSMLFMSDVTCSAILYIEHVFTTKGYARSVSRIELAWLQEVA
ncbi:putative ATP-dependent RNA helicase dhr2, partial [Kluyveromyces marxianus]